MLDDDISNSEEKDILNSETEEKIEQKKVDSPIESTTDNTSNAETPIEDLPTNDSENSKINEAENTEITKNEPVIQEAETAQIERVNDTSEAKEKPTEDTNEEKTDKTVDDAENTPTAEADKAEITNTDSLEKEKDTTQVLSTKETSNTKEKSKEEPKEESAEETVDFSKLGLDELVSYLQKEIKQEIPKIKRTVEEIKQNFQQQFSDLIKEKKELFIKDGGNEIDFRFTSPIKNAFNDLLFEYKTKRERFYKDIEQDQKLNLSKRLELIEDLKSLIDNAEPETMYNDFRALQDRWRAIGKIPRAKYNDVWRTYHHHVERFYDLLHLRNDFRDLDFKHNLEEKIKLTEKAEALAEQNDLHKAFKELQVLHKMWKEEIGPVAREFREEIWSRFSNATKKIHEKRHEFQKEMESKFEENLELKRKVVGKISNLISESAQESHRFWQEKMKELESFRQEFFAIGKVPRAINDKLWNEFKEATREFNKRKNAFYKSIKQEQHQNLQKKQVLVDRAEELKDSDDWEMATDIMKQIQAEWKKIGHVPRKYSDKLWKQFKGACNTYFDRLHNEQDMADKEHVASFSKKKEMLDKLKALEGPSDIDQIKAYNDEWHKLGALPFKMRHLEAKFSKIINSMYGKLDLDPKEIALLKFRNLVDAYYAQGNSAKLDGEKIFVRKKIDEVTKEIQQLENNISFFSNAGDDNPLLKGVRDNIGQHTNQLAIWKAKLEYLSKLDY